MAINAARRRNNSQAATLLGTTEKWRSAMGFPVPPRDELARGAAMGVLATGDATLDAAWRAGRDLSLDDAVTLALATTTDLG